MKKNIIYSLLILFIVAATPAAQKLGIFLSGGYLMPQESVYQKGMSYGIGLNFNFVKFLGIELAALYNQGNVAEGEGGPGKGKMTRMPLQLNLMGRIPVGSKITAMLFVGAHYSWNEYSQDNSVKEGLEPFGFSVESSMESAVGYQGGVGLEYQIGKKVALQLDGRYFMSEGQGKWKITDEVSGITSEGDLPNMKLDFVLAQMSLRYYF